jgi:hypothetical protein
MGITECAICGSADFKVETGKRWFFFAGPYRLTCADCASSFEVKTESSEVRFKTLPNPYSFFEGYFKEWGDLQEVKTVAQSITDNTELAIDYLPGALRYAWQVRVILGTEGEVSPGRLRYRLAWDKPASKEDAERVLSDVEGFQGQVQNVVAEMTGEMATLTGKQLQPYEQILKGFSELLLGMEGVKLAMETQIQEFS